MSPRTASSIRIAAVLAAAPICYLVLVAIDSRSPWVIAAVLCAAFAVGEVVRRLTAPSVADENPRAPDSGDLQTRG